MPRRAAAARPERTEPARAKGRRTPGAASLDARRVAVVTGASSGIGRATAVRFGREGWRVAVCARTRSAIDVTARLVREAGGEALAVGADVGKWEDVQNFAAEVGARWGRVDVLVNNAGTGYEGPVEKFSVEDWNEQLATNLSGPFHCSKAFLPLLRKAPPLRNVINVASVSGMTGHARLSSYCATKFGLRGFTQAFAAEVADEGIRVVAVNPGYVATPMVDGDGPRGSKMIQPDELAELIHFVATAPAGIQLEDVVAWPQRMFAD